MGLFYLKNEDGVDFRYFRKRRYFENILFELRAIDCSRLPIFILIRFWGNQKESTVYVNHPVYTVCRRQGGDWQNRHRENFWVNEREREE
jgi:hypothetical protein